MWPGLDAGYCCGMEGVWGGWAWDGALVVREIEAVGEVLASLAYCLPTHPTWGRLTYLPGTLRNRQNGGQGSSSLDHGLRITSMPPNPTTTVPTQPVPFPNATVNNDHPRTLATWPGHDKAAPVTPRWRAFKQHVISKSMLSPLQPCPVPPSSPTATLSP